MSRTVIFRLWFSLFFLKTSLNKLEIFLIPNFNLTERIEKAVANFRTLLPLNCSNFGLKQCGRPWGYRGRARQLGMKGSEASEGRESVSGDNNWQGVWGCRWSSWGVAHSGKGLIFVFQEFSASIGGASFLAGGLGAGLSFYGV